MPFLYVSYYFCHIYYIFLFLCFFLYSYFLCCIFFSQSCSRSLCYGILLFSLIVFIYRSQVSNYSPESVYVCRIRKFILVREDGGCVFFCLGEKKTVSRESLIFFLAGDLELFLSVVSMLLFFLISVFFCCVHSLSSVVLIIITMMIIRFPAFGIVQILVSTRKIFFAHLKLNFLYFFSDRKSIRLLIIVLLISQSFSLSISRNTH